MHRATPLLTSFRSYIAGGARSVIDKVDDGKLMQEMGGNFLKGESRDKIESPQNYGFTSVVADAIKGVEGQIKQSAETFISFMGGNRSFPVSGNQDDRRHRLKNLAEDAAKGAAGMFGLKEWGQQFLNTETGMFMSGNLEKKMRFALVQNQNGQKQAKSKAGPELARTFKTDSGVEFEIETFELSEEEEADLERRGLRLDGTGKIRDRQGREVDIIAALQASGGSGDGGGGQQGESEETGQKTLHKEQSDTYVDMTKDLVQTRRGQADTRHDKNHAHLNFGNNKVWVDGGGVWSTVPIRLRTCDDQNGSSSGPAPTSGPPAYSARSPLALNSDGQLSMEMQAPLKVRAPARAAELDEWGIPKVSGGGEVYLDIAAPLSVTPDGKLRFDEQKIEALERRIGTLEAEIAELKRARA
jgi:hypothetical protein